MNHPKTQQISPKAEVHPECQIGNNVIVESFSKIGKNVVIGDDTWIGSNVTIFDGARIGKGCKVFPGAVISAIPQDLKYNGEETILEVGDNTTIRECVTLNKGTASKGVTKVGDSCLIMAYSHVAHDSVIGNHCILSNGVQIGGEVEIADWVVMGGGAFVHQFCKIGRHAMVSGMSGVLSDVPPYLKVAGVPVAYSGINYVGLKRRGFEKNRIDIIHDIFRVLFHEKRNTSQAVELILERFEEGVDRDEIITFIKNSSRGIVKGLWKDED